MALAAVAVIALALRRGWQRLEPAPLRPRAFSLAGGAALFLAMFVAGVAGAHAAEVLAGGAPDPQAPTIAQLAPLAAGAYAGQLLVTGLFAILVLRAPRPVPERRPGLGRAGLLGAVAIVAWWPIVQTVSMLAALVWTAVSGQAADPVAHETLRLLQAAARDVWFALLVGAVVLAAPVVEEVLYRGIVQQSLRQMGYPPWPAAAVASLVFAVMHVSVAEPYAVVPLFVLSLGFGWAYERTGRLAAPIVMHALFNLANILLALG